MLDEDLVKKRVFRRSSFVCSSLQFLECDMCVLAKANMPNVNFQTSDIADKMIEEEVAFVRQEEAFIAEHLSPIDEKHFKNVQFDDFSDIRESKPALQEFLGKARKSVRVNCDALVALQRRRRALKSGRMKVFMLRIDDNLPPGENAFNSRRLLKGMIASFSHEFDAILGEVPSGHGAVISKIRSEKLELLGRLVPIKENSTNWDQMIVEIRMGLISFVNRISKELREVIVFQFLWKYT